MKPGEEKKVNLGLSSIQSDRFGPPLSYRIYQEQYSGGAMPRAIELKTNIISATFENGMWAKMLSSIRAPSTNLSASSSGSIIVFGWLDQAPPSVEVAHNRITQKTTALVYTTLDFSLPEKGLLSLPTGLIPGKVSVMPPNSGNCGSSTSIQMGSGTAEYEYKIPGNLQAFRVDTLKLAIWRDTGAAGLPAISLYHWKDQVWTSIQNPIQGTNIIQKAAPYVNENGVIRVQLTSQSSAPGCIYIDLGLDAERIPETGQPAGSGGTQ
jgi:hypothetical protein